MICGAPCLKDDTQLQSASSHTDMKAWSHPPCSECAPLLAGYSEHKSNIGDTHESEVPKYTVNPVVPSQNSVLNPGQSGQFSIL